MNRFAAATAVAFASAFAADSALAASTTTYFTGYDGLKSSHSYTSTDGISITATATAKDNGCPVNAMVGEYSNGLGVTNSVYKYKNPYSYKTTDNNHMVDGYGAQETLWLSFDKEFKLECLLFSYADRNDNVKLINGDTNKVIGSFSLAGGSWSGYKALDLSGLNLSLNKLGIAAYGCDDEFKVKGVKGHAVPTPSAALAGIAGMIALAARRRRNVEQA